MIRTITTYFCITGSENDTDHLIGTIVLPDAGYRDMGYGIYHEACGGRHILSFASFDGSEDVDIEPDTDAAVGKCSVCWDMDRIEASTGMEGDYAAVTVTFPEKHDGPVTVEGIDRGEGFPSMMVNLLVSHRDHCRIWHCHEVYALPDGPVLKHCGKEYTDKEASEATSTAISLSKRVTDVREFIRATMTHHSSGMANEDLYF